MHHATLQQPAPLEQRQPKTRLGLEHYTTAALNSGKIMDNRMHQVAREQAKRSPSTINGAASQFDTLTHSYLVTRRNNQRDHARSIPVEHRRYRDRRQRRNIYVRTGGKQSNTFRIVLRQSLQNAVVSLVGRRKGLVQ